MGGKTGTTTSSVSIPPEVMSRYNAVNAYASDVAKTPFQAYQGQFVAGLTPTQQAAIQNTSQYSQAAQPYYQAATQQLQNAQASAVPGINAAYQNVGQAQDIGSQYAQNATQGIGQALQYSQPYLQGATQAAYAGAQGIQPGQLNTAAYMNPYTQNVANTTYQALNQQQQEQMAGQLGNAIRSGAFGGDRAALAAANLGRQQQLGMAQAMAPIYQQGFQQALQTAQQQQGVQLTAEQANRAAMQNLSQQLGALGQQGYAQNLGAAQQMAALGQQQYGQGMGGAQQLAALAQQGYGMGAGAAQALSGIGTQAQQAGLQGAQAQLGAGTLEQQTQQADLTARYQQFLQERGYPFQTAQFLANIAMGTGALSGNTSTTTQPMPFFSDRRVKHDIKEIGKTNDNQPIYSFKYDGDDRTQIGLMAQDVEKKHPEAVGEFGGIKTVDYKKATEGAERHGHYEGGLVAGESMGGAVNQPGAYNRGGYDVGGGVVDPNDIQALLAQQRTSFGPFGDRGLYGGSQHKNPYLTEKGVIPTASLHVPRMLRPASVPSSSQIQGLGGQALEAYDQAGKIYDRYKQGKQALGAVADKLSGKDQTTTSGVKTDSSQTDTSTKSEDDRSFLDKFLGRADGGVVPRSHFVQGGTAFSDPYKQYEGNEGQIPDEVLSVQDKPELQKPNSPSNATSQTGIGLGDLAKIATLFGLKDGGVAPRHGYATDGSVPPDDETNNYILNAAKSMLRNREGFLAEPKLDKNAYRGGFGTDQFTTPEGKVLPVTPETRFTVEDAERDLARRAPIFMATAQKAIGPDTWKNLTPDTRAALTSVSYNYGTIPRSVVEAAKSGDPAAVADAVYGLRGDNEGINAGRRAFEARFINPQGTYEDNKNPERAGLAPSPTSEPTETGSAQKYLSGLMPDMSKAQSYMKENQGWLGPLGAGLKGMVQSKSPFFGAAALEGIGAGLENIGTTQKNIADVAYTTAAADQATSMAEQIRATTPSKAFNDDGSMNVIDDATGAVVALDPTVVYIRRQKGEKLFPYLGKKGPTTSITGIQDIGAATPSETGTSQNTWTRVPSEGEITVNDPMALNTNEQKAIQRELVNLQGTYPRNDPAAMTRLAQTNTNLKTYVDAVPAASEAQRKNLMYADILSSRTPGIFTGGPYAQFLTDLASKLNQISIASGGSGFRPDENAKIEDALKLYNTMITAARQDPTTAKNAKTIADLESLSATYPFITASREGGNKTMAQIIVNSQDPIDKGALAKNILASTPPSANFTEHGLYVGKNFGDIYSRKRSAIINQDQEAIEKLLNGFSGLYEKDANNRDILTKPITLFGLLARSSVISASTAKQYADRFANGDTRIFRYFPNLKIVPDEAAND